MRDNRRTRTNECYVCALWVTEVAPAGYPILNGENNGDPDEAKCVNEANHNEQEEPGLILEDSDLQEQCKHTLLERLESFGGYQQNRSKRPGRPPAIDSVLGAVEVLCDLAVQAGGA